MKKSLTTFLKISTIANELFDHKTGQELQRIRDHFGAMYTEGQLCALVVVGMVMRVFKLAPEPEPGSRSPMLTIGLLLRFLRAGDWDVSRAVNPLDDLVDQGLKKMGKDYA